MLRKGVLDININNKIIKQFIKFSVVGVLATLIHYGIYLGLCNIIDLNIAYTVGYALSFIFNFLVSNYFTFNTRPSKERGIKFVLAHIFNYILQMGLLNIYIKINIPKELAPFLVYFICVPVNFFLVRKALYKR